MKQLLLEVLLKLELEIDNLLLLHMKVLRVQ
jgi:hypothetical protein